MNGNERFDDTVSGWLHEAAPGALPQRVLAATFERTRGTRQERRVTLRLRLPKGPRLLPAAAGTAAVIVVAIVALNVVTTGLGSPTSSPVRTPAGSDPTATFTVQTLFPSGPVANGLVAFTVQLGTGSSRDVDIWFSGVGQEPRRVVGSDSDTVDDVCPAFSPDGTRLAYGTMDAGGGPGSYRNAALVVVNVAADGSLSDPRTTSLDDGLPAPCPIWSPDGDHVAFSAPLTSPINPTRSGQGSSVRIITLSTGRVDVIPNLLATALAWAPDAGRLAIVGGVEPSGGELPSAIRLYDLTHGTLLSLDGTLGAVGVAWSPDGGRLAYQRDGLRVIDLATGTDTLLVGDDNASQVGAPGGPFGPAWSPDGATIAYGRRIVGRAEKQELVLVKPPAVGPANPGDITVMPHQRVTADGSNLDIYPRQYVWSPDGAYLLCVGWVYPDTGSEETWAVAVPTVPAAPVVVVGGTVGAGVDVVDYADDSLGFRTQVWQRLPDGPRS